MKINRRIILTILGAMMASIALTFASRFDFYFFAFVVLISVPAFILTSLISLSLMMIAKIKKRESQMSWARRVGVVVLLSFIIGLTIPGSLYLWEYDKKTSMKFCESLIPMLINYKTTHGSYPYMIEKLELKYNFPRLLTKYRYYSSHGQFFRFKIENIGPQAYWTVYDSRKKIWEDYDPIAEGFEF